MSERFIMDDAGTLIDMESRTTYDYVSEVCDLLNKQEETINELKTRNKRQYELLKELTDLMFKRDWETLNDMVDEWEKEEEYLQKYGG